MVASYSHNNRGQSKRASHHNASCISWRRLFFMLLAGNILMLVTHQLGRSQLFFVEERVDDVMAFQNKEQPAMMIRKENDSPTRETTAPIASPTAVSVASPTTVPAASPTGVPVSSPTATPVASPKTATPVASPTAVPVASPISSPPTTTTQRALVSTSYPLFERRKPVTRTLNIMNDAYITLWLHHAHTWFTTNDNASNNTIRNFVQEAKDAGFGAIMTDLPWAWTERQGPGQYDIDSFGKDWIANACELGLQLHIVLSMREFPPWIDLQTEQHKDYVELASPSCGSRLGREPSPAHPQVWALLRDYVGNTTQLLLNKYGSCIATISPTMNNEFETRYTQTYGAMRDYSNASIALYHAWQTETLGKPKPSNPPGIPCHAVCNSLRQKPQLEWMAYRQHFLKDRYIQMCQLIKTVKQQPDSTAPPIGCLLHMGEMMASTDHLNSNLFFDLVLSDAIDHVVMDSNMMLLGAPTSPSVVGVMVSIARLYNKVVHYELATERVIQCDAKGNLMKASSTDPDRGANLLTRAGVAHALDASVQSLGVTNLCKPSLAKDILPIEANGSGQRELKTAADFHPTAVVFVPYQVFLAFSFTVLGATCGLPPIACWHESFPEIPTFGHGGLAMSKPDAPQNMCPTDAAQNEVLMAWDELRTRHEHVAVVGDVKQLEAVASRVEERVLIRFPCIMEEKEWHLFGGDELLQMFNAINSTFAFTERRSILC